VAAAIVAARRTKNIFGWGFVTSYRIESSVPEVRVRHGECHIGLEFYTATKRWRCTDMGSRTIIAIALDAPDESWYNGPPYAVSEIVFDEYDFDGMSVSPDDVCDEPPSPETRVGWASAAATLAARQEGLLDEDRAPGATE